MPVHSISVRQLQFSLLKKVSRGQPCTCHGDCTVLIEATMGTSIPFVLSHASPNSQQCGNVPLRCRGPSSNSKLQLQSRRPYDKSRVFLSLLFRTRTVRASVEPPTLRSTPDSHSIALMQPVCLLELQSCPARMSITPEFPSTATIVSQDFHEWNKAQYSSSYRYLQICGEDPVVRHKGGPYKRGQ